MKRLSTEQVNRMRSGQTLFWVVARVDENMQLVTEIKEKLLQGKKTILAPKLFYSVYQPATATFLKKKGADGKPEIFQVPVGPLGKKWFFAKRRAAMRAIKELRAGYYPQVMDDLHRLAIQATTFRKHGFVFKNEYPRSDKDLSTNPWQQLVVRAYGESEIQR